MSRKAESEVRELYASGERPHEARRIAEAEELLAWPREEQDRDWERYRVALRQSVINLLEMVRCPIAAAVCEREAWWSKRCAWYAATLYEIRETAKHAHAETLRVFDAVDGATAPREAAKQAADYMLEAMSTDGRWP